MQAARAAADRPDPQGECWRPTSPANTRRRSVLQEARDICRSAGDYVSMDAVRGPAQGRGGPHRLPRDAAPAARRDRRGKLGAAAGRSDRRGGDGGPARNSALASQGRAAVVSTQRKLRPCRPGANPRWAAIVSPMSAKPRPPIGPAPISGPEGEDRNLFARVVGTAPGGIAAVVGGDDGEVARLQLRMQLRQSAVEGFERRGIAGNVAAMADTACRNRRNWPRRGRRRRAIDAASVASKRASLLGALITSRRRPDGQRCRRSCRQRRRAARRHERGRGASARAAARRSRGGCRCA